MARKKPRAWSSLKKTHDEARVNEKLSERVADELARMSSWTMKQLADEYNALWDEYERVEKRKKELDGTFAAFDKLMNKWLEDNGTDTWRDKDSGSTFYPKYGVLPEITDKRAFYEHLKTTGQLGKLKLPWPTLRADCEEALGPGGNGVVPPGVKVFIKTTIQRRKA